MAQKIECAQATPIRDTTRNGKPMEIIESSWHVENTVSVPNKSFFGSILHASNISGRDNIVTVHE